GHPHEAQKPQPLSVNKSVGTDAGQANHDN
ncbi:MAG: hypothetical protein QOD62_3025, partial [Actinomycetota bacterium]|nr:hypothetical protein [Actinomycetota bacterium]